MVEFAEAGETEEKSPVEVRRKTAGVLESRRIGMFIDLSGRRTGRIGDQTP